MKAARAKVYRNVEILRQKLTAQGTLMERWKKRYLRLEEKLASKKTTPRSKTKKMLRKCKVTPEVRRELVFHNAIIDSIRRRYQENNDCKSKQVLRRAVANVQKKYKVMRRLSTRLGICRKAMMKDNMKDLKYQRKIRSDRTDNQTNIKIQEFLERDDNSRQMPGKKDTVTKQQVKKQKRLLNDTMKALHAKFVYENPRMKMSYSSFCKFKPFWITKPSLKDLETCMCKKCTNMLFMHQRLKTEGVISAAQPQDSISEVVCDKNNHKCAYGECDQ